MYQVSDNYKTAVYAPTRTAKGRVTFDISDTTAVDDISSITTTAEAAISNKQQLINKKRDISFNLATCEPDRFKLDGTFCFPDDNLINNKEMGFCSGTLCDAAGSFNPYPTITFQFNGNHSSMGLTITFDQLNNEYATDFNITAYDAASNVITSVDVTGNNLVQCTPTGQLYNYRKIVLTIKKWCRSNRRARVCEVDFGVVRVYEDNSLIKMSLVEELDLTSSKLPSAEFKFTVDNSLREFNILNPSGFYKFLQQRQQVVCDIGIELPNGLTEYVQIGNYLLWDWTSDEGSLTASFTARTNIDTMSSVDYENLTVKNNYSLYQMAVDVFTLCGIKNYWIDIALQSIYTNALVKKTNCKNVLQMIAIASCANVFVSRDNTIFIKVLPNSLNTAADIIDMDNMYSPPQIKLDDIVKSVAVTYYTDLNTKQIVTVNNVNTSDGKALKLETNTLINTLAQATTVANWILSQRNYRAIYTANWRQNPAHELSDIVTIEDSYNQNKNSFITKIQLEYQGYLSGKTEARGLTDVTT